ncbi:double-strand break repair helicase AddA [Sphingomonas sp. CL5.1]|uniref:double-strand break repair helicase AddA n=1 Tax=Sphingomonas sp. CL5.1 TaxID=2653203 RepID=UPI001583C675|nr:double-strand break repair helicase AddA [Sphingomonas sp. CL5.1]QKS00988.1 double-strand break repair helicase AddA [Sphingomonas sp. CL5.1]
MAVTADALAPLPPLRGEQRTASRPDSHVWLSASAGTGKTQVLAARVFRLLLRGVEPGAILCLTFTKAGAAEMAARVSQRLAAWVRAPETVLAKDLIALGEEPTPQRVARARTLFAKVLDAPGGGLRIQTIHGFCQGLLAAFPAEAGLVPGFRPIEPREEALLMRQALADLLVDAEREGRDGPAATIGALSVRLGEEKAEAFLRDCARAGRALEALPAGVGPYVRRALGLPAGDVEDTIRAACGDDAIDRRALETIAALNREWGTKNGVTRAEAIATWLALGAEQRAAALDDLHAVWARADGDPRSFGKGQAPQEPAYADLAMRLHGQCAELLSLRVRAAFADLLADALTVGRDYARGYAAAKRRTGAVDFDDLIAATVDLFDQPGIGEWVRFKLDQITEHVLIDEAQDTNANQWRIVRALVDEYFVGRGVHAPSTRTLFTVGDHKQAIFGFQGTDPINFVAAERYFAGRADEVRGDDHMPDEERGLAFEKLSLLASFRSTRPVLEFVDAAIGLIGHEALGMAESVPPHASEVPGPGVVELWPPVCAGAGEGDDGEEQWIDDAVRENAARIARQVRAWLDQGLMLESKGRALRPEDVMILVKRRGELAQLLVARLYAEGVPVAGVDRLRLNAPLAVQDLLAAIRFVLQPEDDLSLAILLVSPLIGWTQEELLDRAVPRSGSLWRHLSARHRDLLAPLDAMLARADFTTPYQFLEELLSGALDGRRKLLERLGEEARDPIEELLSAALDFETSATPSLQRFLDWFDRGEVEIVRDAAQPRDAVRVMTAHGAKGLQAPLVILADATADPDAAMRSALMWAPPDLAAPLPVFRPRKDERAGEIDAVVAATDLRERQEHWRLFYVAATRAEERLVIAGSLSAKWQGVPPPESWYGLAAGTFDALGVAGEGVRTFAGIAPPTAAKPRAATRAERFEAPAVPEWARRPAPQEQRPPRPLAPSSLGEDEVADPPPGPAMRASAERGRLIHALFERLPAVASPDRARAADRWLADVGQVADAAGRAAIVEAALRVIDDPAHAALFGPDALAEAPVSAVLPDGMVVAGTVDRLLVTDTLVRIVDFKTARRVPRSVDEVPPYHLRQMAAYAAALAVIFPGHRIEAALLYTGGPLLVPLSADLLAEHKPRYRMAEQS